MERALKPAARVGFAVGGKAPGQWVAVTLFRKKSLKGGCREGGADGTSLAGGVLRSH